MSARKPRRSPARQSVKMADIARMAGVDTSTVSRALSGSPRVTEETRARIEELVRETGYVINSSAKSLRNGKACQVLVMVADIAASFYPEVVRGIEDVMFANGFGVMLGSTMKDPDREAELARQLLTGVVDGLLTMTGEIPPQLRSLPNYQHQIVAISRSTGDPGIPCIRVDNEMATTEAMEYLYSLGHRDIAHIAGPPPSTVFESRVAAYEAFMRARGLEKNLRIRRVQTFDFAAGAACMSEILAADKHTPTAVLCANDDVAIGAMAAAREAGLRIPDDISIIGFDGLPVTGLICPGLTTVCIPRRELGRMGAELLLTQLQQQKPSPRDAVLQHRLIVRESCSPPKPARASRSLKL